MSNNIEVLRGHLFDTLRDLRNPDKPMDIDRAKAVADVARVVIDSAKVEVEHLRVVGGTGSGFIPQIEDANGTNRKPPPDPKDPPGVTRSVVHRLR
jgi:hypothetical protein